MAALADLVVIDLTHMLAGPFSGMLLADLGARTIKVEPPGVGERTRPLLADDPKNSMDGMGAYFMALNRNKQSACIDLKKPEGLQLFFQLVKKADVVLSNFGPGVLERLKIDHTSLIPHNPRIITCAITGFGESGPGAERPAFDIVAQGYGGGMSITGAADGPPMRAGIPIGDLGGGMFSTIGILAALHTVARTGQGQHVDISMQDCQVSLLSYITAMHSLSGEVPHRTGNAHTVHVPYNTFQAQDEWMIIAVVTDDAWVRCCDVLEVDTLREARFATRARRLANIAELENLLNERLGQKPRAHWLDKFRAARISAAPVNNVGEALSDEQIRARNMLVDVTMPSGNTVALSGNPVKLSGEPETTYASPPMLGQHTDEILRELCGTSDSEIERLREAGIIA
jgi:crotonobetainyl-CoA:carnitine CoA-transferase CaiB-like acyl-CoA transferase